MPTAKQRQAVERLAENVRNPNPKSTGEILREVGYTTSLSESPTKVTKSKGFLELLEQHLPDDKLTKAHLEVLDTKKIEHMVFPLSMTDDDITELVESVNGVVQKFQHSETANHVWYWAADGKLKLDAVKLAYALKGRLGKPDDTPVSNTYNTFVQQNNINPNAVDAKTLVENTLEMLMNQTREE